VIIFNKTADCQDKLSILMIDRGKKLARNLFSFLLKMGKIRTNSFSFRRSRHPPGFPDPGPIVFPYHPDSSSDSRNAGKPVPATFGDSLHIFNTLILTVEHDEI